VLGSVKVKYSEVFRNVGPMWTRSKGHPLVDRSSYAVGSTLPVNTPCCVQSSSGSRDPDVTDRGPPDAETSIEIP